jgi:hypothetical protein
MLVSIDPDHFCGFSETQCLKGELLQAFEDAAQARSREPVPVAYRPAPLFRTSLLANETGIGPQAIRSCHRSRSLG